VSRYANNNVKFSVWRVYLVGLNYLKLFLNKLSKNNFLADTKVLAH